MINSYHATSGLMHPTADQSITNPLGVEHFTPSLGFGVGQPAQTQVSAKMVPPECQNSVEV